MDGLYLSHVVEYLDKEVLLLHMTINLKHQLHDKDRFLDKSLAIHCHCLLGDILILELYTYLAYTKNFPSLLDCNI